MMRAVVLVLALASCGRSPTSHALADELTALAGAAEPVRTSAVAAWKLDRAGWERSTTEPYRAHYAEYARAFDALAPALVTRLATRGAIATRAHFAGDPRLTVGQARARWALPVQYPSEIAELAGAPIDAVFVRDGTAWRAIVGVDAMIQAHAAALDPTCAALLATVIPGRCSDAAWVVAEAALRDDQPRLARACTLAAPLCTR